MSYEQLAQQSLLAFEPFVGMIYFAPEAHQRYAALGVKERPGYFCSRSAAMGRQSGAVVAAAFYNFNPQFVIECIEAGWSATTPEAITQARYAAVQEALARLLAPNAGEEDLSANIEAALPLVKKATAALPLAGRVLFAAHHAQPWPEEPTLALWHGINLLREYRGDGHNAVLLTLGIDPVEALLLQAAYSSRISFGLLQKTRAWSEEAVEAGRSRLSQRGLLQEGVLTEAGKQLRQQVEELTSRLDVAPFEALGEADSQKLVALVGALGRRIVEHGGIPFLTKPPTA